jgi:hypothetical protein
MKPVARAAASGRSGNRFEVFAIAAAVLVLLSSLSFVDGLLIATQAGVFLAGLGAAFLLGNAPGSSLAAS